MDLLVSILGGFGLGATGCIYGLWCKAKYNKIEGQLKLAEIQRDTAVSKYNQFVETADKALARKDAELDTAKRREAKYNAKMRTLLNSSSFDALVDELNEL